MSYVKYPNPECHLDLRTLSLACLYDRQWKERVTLQVGGEVADTYGNNSTIGYWLLPTPYSNDPMNRIGTGLAIYNLSFEWHCPFVKKLYSTFPFSVGEKQKSSSFKQMTHLILDQHQLHYPLFRRGWLQQGGVSGSAAQHHPTTSAA